MTAADIDWKQAEALAVIGEGATAIDVSKSPPFITTIRGLEAAKLLRTIPGAFGAAYAVKITPAGKRALAAYCLKEFGLRRMSP